MVKVQVTQVVPATPDDVFGLVMDIERYATLDDKINPVLWSRRTGDRVEFACRPKLVGLRQPKVVQYLELTPGRRIDIGLLPRPANRLAHATAHFEASFECTPTADGTRIVRTLEFTFTPVVRWLMEPLFRRRLEPEVRDEMERVRAYFDARR